jgi:CPA1 family monovalent cation:H+ antiporter
VNLTIERIESLLLIAALVALGAKRLRLPSTVGLVLAGATLAYFGFLEGYVLTRDLIFRTLLPPLIFEAAFFIRWKELRHNFTPILILAS